MRYFLPIVLDERASAARTQADVRAAMAAHVPYIEMLRKNRKYVASDPLAYSRSARTLRCAAGKPFITEGPFAEGHEQVGGFYVIEAVHLDEAIETAKRCPALTTEHDDVLGMEIRPMPLLGTAEGASPPPAERASLDRFFLAFYRREDDAEPEDALTRMASSMQPLFPSSSTTTLRRRGSEIELTDGPFFQRPDQLAGYRIVWARGIDDAIGWVSANATWREELVAEIRAIRSQG